MKALSALIHFAMLRVRATLRRTRRLMALLNVIALCVGVADAPVAFALQVKLSQGLRIRNYNGQALDGGGILRAGSVVDIPDRFRVSNSDGSPNAELTVNNWLANAGHTGLQGSTNNPGLYTKKDDRLLYFYPVKVVRAAPGSYVPSQNGRVYFMALQMMVRNGDGTQLQVSEDASISTRPPGENDRESDQGKQNQLEGKTPCADGSCATSDETHASGAIDELVNALEPALNAAEIQRHKFSRRTSDDFDHLQESFRRTCGFGVEEFVPVVREQARAAGIPSAILLSMMIQESSGQCYQRNDADSGLFQIRYNSTKYPRCSDREIRQLQRMSPGELASGPHCLENPLINLRESIRVLKSKISILTKPSVKVDLDKKRYTLPGFDASKMVDSKGRITASAWRIITSAYNGGERWVLLAKNDLETFNRRNGTNLNPYNWEDLRIFYLRNYLDRKPGAERKYFGREMPGRTTSALKNLAYAENVLPRRRNSDGPKTVADLWFEYLRI